MKAQKRPQRQKATSEHVRHVQELRRSNAAQPIPSIKDLETKRIRKYGLSAVLEDDDDDDNPYLWSDSE